MVSSQPAVVSALTQDQRRFLDAARRFAPLAEASGVPGAVMVAQAVLESGWGRSGLARLGGAWFGIKATRSWRGRVYSGTAREWLPRTGYVTVPGRHRVYASPATALADGCVEGSLFRAYSDVEENVRDYLRFFRVNPRYHAALRRYALTRDARRFALDIARAGYATSPAYASHLMQVMAALAPSVTVWFNGRMLPEDAVRLLEGRVFVRLRLLSRMCGWQLHYDQQEKVVRVDAIREEEGR